MHLLTGTQFYAPAGVECLVLCALCRCAGEKKED